MIELLDDRLPERGEKVTLPTGETLTAKRISKNRVAEVIIKFEKPIEEESEKAESSGENTEQAHTVE